MDRVDLVEDEEKWRAIRAARFDVTLELMVVVVEDEGKGEEEEVEKEKDEEGQMVVGLAGLVGEEEEGE